MLTLLITLAATVGYTVDSTADGDIVLSSGPYFSTFSTFGDALAVITSYRVADGLEAPSPPA